jgi:hypothetical protein
MFMSLAILLAVYIFSLAFIMSGNGCSAVVHRTRTELQEVLSSERDEPYADKKGCDGVGIAGVLPSASRTRRNAQLLQCRPAVPRQVFGRHPENAACP